MQESVKDKTSLRGKLFKYDVSLSISDMSELVSDIKLSIQKFGYSVANDKSSGKVSIIN